MEAGFLKNRPLMRFTKIAVTVHGIPPLFLMNPAGGFLNATTSTDRPRTLGVHAQSTPSLVKGAGTLAGHRGAHLGAQGLQRQEAGGSQVPGQPRNAVRPCLKTKISERLLSSVPGFGPQYQANTECRELGRSPCLSPPSGLGVQPAPGVWVPLLSVSTFSLLSLDPVDTATQSTF